MRPLVFFFVFFLLWAFYAGAILRGVWGPLIGPGDTDSLPQMGFLFGRMLNWFPVPRLTFFTDWIFYPYGIENIFQAWNFELGYLSLLFDVHSAWLPAYAAASVGIIGIGTFALLRPFYSVNRSGFTALCTAFFGFYSFHKYPHHFSFAVCHWMILNLVADFVVYRQLVQTGKLALRWVGIRAALLLLLLGQDLSYCAGYGLCSFSLTFLFCLLELRRRRAGRAQLRDWKRELMAHPREFVGWGLACALIAWLYVPLCAQVFFAARAHPVGYAGSYWANPFRWLLPWFPFLHPGQGVIGGDRPEGLGAASPGWALIALGIVGGRIAWKSRQRAYIPLALLVALCVLHHPQDLPVLKIFPWFSFLRVAGRSTLIFPVFLALLALEIQPFRNATAWRAALGTWSVVAALELLTAYYVLLPGPTFKADEKFWNYQRTVAQSPGEAIFDWPFCICSGNGTTTILCPYPMTIGSDTAMQRFTEKKTIGLNLGRLTPELARDYLESGWRYLFSPNAEHTRQARCFGDAEWKFFDDFYTAGDFAGLQIHTDFLPPECLAEFHTRFGGPVATTRFAGSGPAEFIPKDAARRSRIDVARAKTLRFEPPLRAPMDLMKDELPYGFVLDNIEAVRTHASGASRSFVARDATISFFLDRATSVAFEATLETFYPGQSVELAFNGVPVPAPVFDATGHAHLVWKGMGKPGKNQLAWKFAQKGDWWQLIAAARAKGLPWTGWNAAAREFRNRPVRIRRLVVSP